MNLIKKYFSPFFVGQCCVDQVIAPPDSSTSNSGLNEVISLTNVSTYTLQWNATRKARFGDFGVFQVWILYEDGKWRPTGVEAIPNDPDEPTQYSFDFGGLSTVRIIIT